MLDGKATEQYATHSIEFTFLGKVFLLDTYWRFIVLCLFSHEHNASG